MAGANSERHRKTEVSDDAHQYLLQGVVLVGGLHALEHFAEDDAAHIFQPSAKFQLHQHAVNLERLRREIFEEKNRVVCFDLVGSSQRGDQDGETASIENALSAAFNQRRNACIHWNIPGGWARQARLPRLQIDSARMRPVFGHHGAVEHSDVCGVQEVSKQACDVAVADKYLGMRFDLREIEFLDQIIGAIASARANDGADVVAREHLFEFACAAGG